MAVNPDGDRLPCGRDIDQLWEHLDTGAPDQHAPACPHCQAALAEIRPLFQAFTELAAEPVSPPDDLSARIMTVIRARIHPGARIPLPAPAGMRLDISERAAAMILRTAGDTIDGVRTRSCRLTPAARDGRTSASLKLTVSLRYSMAAPAAAKAVRAAVRAAASRQLGVTLADVDIEVADIHLG
jgi:uncharacterized alkaline shock family protein YloU